MGVKEMFHMKKPGKTERLVAIGVAEGAILGTAMLPPVGFVIGGFLGGITAYTTSVALDSAWEYTKAAGWTTQFDPTYPHDFGASALPGSEPIHAGEPHGDLLPHSHEKNMAYST